MVREEIKPCKMRFSAGGHTLNANLIKILRHWRHWECPYVCQSKQVQLQSWQINWRHDLIPSRRLWSHSWRGRTHSVTFSRTKSPASPSSLSSSQVCTEKEDLYLIGKCFLKSRTFFTGHSTHSGFWVAKSGIIFMAPGSAMSRASLYVRHATKLKMWKINGEH